MNCPKFCLNQISSPNKESSNKKTPSSLEHGVNFCTLEVSNIEPFSARFEQIRRFPIKKWVQFEYSINPQRFRAILWWIKREERVDYSGAFDFVDKTSKTADKRAEPLLYDVIIAALSV